MTISSDVRTAGPFIGNGSTTAFPFTFKVFSSDDVVAVSTVVATGASTTLSFGGDCTLSLNSDQDTNPGGTVTYTPSGVPMASTEELSVTSDIAATQTLDLTNSGGFFPRAINAALDKMVVLIQQITSRAVQVPAGDPASGGMVLPGVDARRNMYMGFGADGTPGAYNPASGGITDAANVNYLDPRTGAVSATVAKTLRQIALVTFAMTPTQQDDVFAKTGALDVTAPITTAVAAGVSLFWPEGKYNVSPIASSVTGTLVGPPPAAEVNRTSGWVLGDNQSMYGVGAATDLQWGTPSTKQFFFKVSDANNVEVRNMSFTGGYGAVVVDPASDGSLDTLTISDNYFNGMLSDLVLGRQWAVYRDSKYSKNITVKGNHSRDCVNHCVILTNTYNAKVEGNDFVNVGGFCVDASQGTHGVTISGNTGKNVLYFAKAESSQPAAGATAGEAASNRVVVSDNEIEEITSIGFFLNSAADNVAITGNVFSGAEVGIKLDTVTAYTHNGNVTISGNTLYGSGSGSSIGIEDKMTNGTLAHVYEANVIDNFAIGYSIARPKASISGGSVNASGSAIVLDSAGLIDGISILGVTIVAGGSGVSVSGTTAFKRLKIRDCPITYAGASGVYAGLANASLCDISGNTLNGTAAATSGIVLKSAQSCGVVDNGINIPAGAAANAIDCLTATTDCIITLNRTSKPVNVVGAAGTTVSTGNIISAYVA